MKNTFLVIVMLFSLTGCATAKLPTGPETHALVQHEEVAVIGVAKATDKRDSKKAGTIGAAVIQVNGNDLVEFVTNHFIHYINDKAGLNVMKVDIQDSDVIEEVLATHQISGLAVLKIKELKIFSIDALIQPVEVDLTLELSIFDKSGDQVYNHTVMGHYEKRIGLTVVANSTGELVEFVVQDALNQYVKDPELRKIIMKFKLGSVTNIFKILKGGNKA